MNAGSSPWEVHAEDAYREWRDHKLSVNASTSPNNIQQIDNIAQITDEERARLVNSCAIRNFAIYEVNQSAQNQNSIRTGLRLFAQSLELKIAEKHRSAEGDGIVPIRVTNQKRQRGYIPYSRKPMNWHTDGYYNQPEDQILAMVLHCARPADDGGYNQFLDPEIAYMHLRDINPDYISALMHPRAMMIPENQEDDGTIRPVSIGPVFSVTGTGKLAMRYTARTRSIEWRDDAMTRQAVGCLRELLESDNPFIHSVKLSAGQGILCNNVLHNRTGFADDGDSDNGRLLYRIRFHNRVGGT